jgi:hypothetical protein
MLAEIFLLRLQDQLRTLALANPPRDQRFVPVVMKRK